MSRYKNSLKQADQKNADLEHLHYVCLSLHVHHTIIQAFKTEFFNLETWVIILLQFV